MTGSSTIGGAKPPKSRVSPAASAQAQMPRGPSSKSLLEMKWDYPVYTASEPVKSEGTDVKAPRHALPAEEALRRIAGSDHRPLLVLRECSFCNKTDDALLTPGVDNERTILLSRWFHCVKLPVDVIESSHPFNALFPTDDAEHLFVASADGAGRIALESDTSRVDLWSAMGKVLTGAYAKDPAAASKEVGRALDRLDVLDTRIVELEKRHDKLMETAARLDPAKVKKVEADIDDVKKEIAVNLESIQGLTRIDLKPASSGAEMPAKAGR